MIGQESLFISLPFIGVVTIVAGVALLLVGASQDGKEQKSKSDSVRHVYLYLTSFATLLIASSAIATLIAIGIQSFGTDNRFQSPPPSMYLTEIQTKEVAPVEPLPLVTCTEDCSLTTTQREQISLWTDDYRNWQENETGNRAQSQGLVAGLSFLIIGAVVYIFHWRLAKRERRRADGAPLMVRSIYLWAMSFVMLVTIVVSGGFVINTVLKEVVPGAQDSNQIYRSTPAPTDTAAMTALANCGEKCELDADTIAFAKSWQTDFDTWSGKQNDRSLASRLADTLPYLLVALPLFWYHFKTVRKESKNEGVSTKAV